MLIKDHDRVSLKYLMLEVLLFFLYLIVSRFHSIYLLELLDVILANSIWISAACKAGSCVGFKYICSQ